MTQKSIPLKSNESPIDRWASQPLKNSANNFLAAIRSEIPVSLIATPRADFICEYKRRWKSINANEKFKDFDQVPLTDNKGRILGVYVRDVGRYDLREDMFMAADAPLLSFIESADQNKFRFLIVNNAVTGIATISDIQKLPVYSVLFSLIIAVEMLLMEWIRRTCRNNPDQWLSYLNKSNEKKRLEKHWQNAIDKNMMIDRISCATFGQEIHIAKCLGLFTSNDDQIKKLELLENLRNHICHAKEIAPNLDQALKIPSDARNAHSIIVWLQERIEKIL